MTDIRPLPADKADNLIPLLRQVHDLHCVELPDLHRLDPSDAEITEFLTRWLSEDDVTALITGPEDAPTAYLLYVIETRAESVLTPARTRAMIHHISVDRDHRRLGLGTALIAAMRDRIAGQGIDQIAVTYGVFNTASAALMTKSGLHPVFTMAIGPVAL